MPPHLWPYFLFLPYRQTGSMTPTRRTAPQSRPRSLTWLSRCSARITSLPLSNLTWRAALSTRTCGWPASPMASVCSRPGPSRSTNATQEIRTSSARWTCRWEIKVYGFDFDIYHSSLRWSMSTDIWVFDVGCVWQVVCFYNEMGLALKAKAHGNWGLSFWFNQCFLSNLPLPLTYFVQ